MNPIITMKLAVDAHHGQWDDSGLPYILHPIRVSSSIEIHPKF